MNLNEKVANKIFTGNQSIIFLLTSEEKNSLNESNLAIS